MPTVGTSSSDVPFVGAGCTKFLLRRRWDSLVFLREKMAAQNCAEKNERPDPAEAGGLENSHIIQTSSQIRPVPRWATKRRRSSETGQFFFYDPPWQSFRKKNGESFSDIFGSWSSSTIARALTQRLMCPCSNFLLKILHQRSATSSLHARQGERATGIEPAWPAWKAGTLPLSYARAELSWREAAPKPSDFRELALRSTRPEALR